MTDDKEFAEAAEQAVEAQADAQNEAADEDEAQDEAAEDLDLRKIASGIYNVWLVGDSVQRRLGSVARIATGEWLAYSTTGHAGKEHYRTRADAADALAAARRKG